MNTRCQHDYKEEMALLKYKDRTTIRETVICKLCGNIKEQVYRRLFGNDTPTQTPMDGENKDTEGSIQKT